MFSFTPLQGAQTLTQVSQSLLELDGGVKVLVGVGWDDQFDASALHNIEKHVTSLSFILLTHPTLSHIGAYAHCCKHFAKFTQIPVYATAPVIAFGRTLIQDIYACAPRAAGFLSEQATERAPNSSTQNRTKASQILLQPPSPEETSKYFASIIPLKYLQPHQPSASPFSAPLEGLTLTAYNAGHSIGGTIWHIQHGTESIVYAVDWNQTRENVISGAAWFGGIGGSEVVEQLRRPTALVCSSRGGNRVALPGGRRKRDDLLLDNVRSCLARGGTVLIPSDSSARVLEIAWLLEHTCQEAPSNQIWKDSKIFFASRSASTTVRHARSLLEWMDESIVREFEGEDENVPKSHQRTSSKQVNGVSAKNSRPFQFRHVKLIERQRKLDRILKENGPKVILASDSSMQWGFSSTALRNIAQNSQNLVILTERLNCTDENMGVVKNTAQRLWQWFDERRDGVALEKGHSGDQIEQVHSGGQKMLMQLESRVPLDLHESQVYQEYMATIRQLQNTLDSNDEAQATAGDDIIEDESSSSSSDDSDDEHQGRALNVSTALGHAGRSKVALTEKDLGVTVLLRKKEVHDFDVREKRGRNSVFPYAHTRKRADSFGEYIKADDYLRAEEKVEQEDTGFEKPSGSVQKRKWELAGNVSKENDARKRHRGGKNEDKADSEAHGIADDDTDMSSDESDDEPETSIVEGPAKLITSSESLIVAARLAFVDFGGIHDQRSLQMLIPLIGPKKLVLVHGDKTETQALAADCRSLLSASNDSSDDVSSTEVLTPANGETVDASVDTNAWIVKVSRTLAKRLQWQNVRNLGVVTLTGHLKGETTVHESEDDKVNLKKPKLDEPKETTEKTNASVDVRPLLDLMPATMAAATRTVAQPLHVGDLRLADLRHLMIAADPRRRVSRRGHSTN